MILERLLKHELLSGNHMLLLVLVAGVVTLSPLLLGSVSRDLFKSMDKTCLAKNRGEIELCRRRID